MTVLDGDPITGVVLITGVMAAGKSTVARALAARLHRSVHIPGDVFRRMIVSGREELLPVETPEARAQLELRYRLSAMVVDTYAAAGWTVITQDVILGPDLADHVARIRTRPLYVVVLAPGPEVVAAREAGRDKVGYGAWSVENLDGGLRGTPRIGLWLDTGRQRPDESVEAILAGLPTALIASDPAACTPGGCRAAPGQ